MGRNKTNLKLKNLTEVATNPNSDFGTALEAVKKRWRLKRSNASKKLLKPVLNRLLKNAPNDFVRIEIATLIADMKAFVPAKMTQEELDARAARAVANAAVAEAKAARVTTTPASQLFDPDPKVMIENICKARLVPRGDSFCYWSMSPKRNPSRIEEVHELIAPMFAEAGLKGDTIDDYRALEDVLWKKREQHLKPPNEHGVRLAFDEDDDNLRENITAIFLLGRSWENKFPMPPKNYRTIIQFDRKGHGSLVNVPLDYEPLPTFDPPHSTEQEPEIDSDTDEFDTDEFGTDDDENLGGDL